MRKAKIWQNLLSLIALMVFCIAVYFLTKYLIVGMSKLSPNVVAALIAALAASAAAIYTQRQTRLREIEESHRANKIEIYNAFMDLVEYFMTPAQKKEDIPDFKDGELPDDLREMFNKIKRGMIFWASPAVLKSYQEIQHQKNDGIDILTKADRVYKAMRKDLGHSNSGLKEGDLIKLFLKNPDDYDNFKK